MRRRKRAGTGTDAAFFPGGGGRRYTSVPWRGDSFSFDFPYDPMKSSNSPSLSPPSGGEKGSDTEAFSLLATARRKVRVPAASRAAKKQQLRFAFRWIS
jgi:hypothetical protein